MNKREKKEREAVNIHSGHRERIRQRFLKDGYGSFEFHEKIEFLLFGANSRSNTNEDAHILAKGFNKSIIDIFEADIDTLIKNGKITKSMAVYIKFLHELIKEYNIEKINCTGGDKEIDADTSQIYAAQTTAVLEKIKERFIVQYAGITEETVRLVTLNNRTEIIEDEVIHVGDFDLVAVNAGNIAKTVFARNASGIILAHNHPNGVPIPSAKDVMTTKRLKNILADININLIEHYVIAGNSAKQVSPLL